MKEPVGKSVRQTPLLHSVGGEENHLMKRDRGSNVKLELTSFKCATCSVRLFSSSMSAKSDTFKPV